LGGRENFNEHNTQRHWAILNNTYLYFDLYLYFISTFGTVATQVNMIVLLISAYIFSEYTMNCPRYVVPVTTILLINVN
jgi:hypothetical protein